MKDKRFCGGASELVGQLPCIVTYNEKLISTLCYATNCNAKLRGANWLRKLSHSNPPIDTFCKRVQTTQQCTNTLMKLFPSIVWKAIFVAPSTGPIEILKKPPAWLCPERSVL